MLSQFYCTRVSICMISCCMAFNALALNTHMSLKRALATKTVSLSAVSNGGWRGKSIKLALTNNTAKELTIDVDPGLIFVPDDTTYQDLVLLGGETLAVGPSSRIETDLQTLCGKSYAKTPWPRLQYRYNKQGDSNMVKTLKYANTNNIPPEVTQHAVWMFTCGHCLSTVYSSEYPRMSEDLVQYIASVKKMKVPLYFTSSQLQNRPGQYPVIAGREKTYVNMHWKADDGYRHMRLYILKENGEPYREIEAGRIIDKYGYTVQVEFDAQRDPKGKYIVMLRDDADKIWDQKTVVIGAGPCDVY